MISRISADFDADMTYDVSAFSDVGDEAWYAVNVGYAAQKEIVKGYEDGSFRPNNPISRAECVVLLSRLIEVPAGSSAFSDVPETHWAYSAISAGASAGWLAGYPDGTFRPDQNITRLEAVKMINTAFHRTCDVNYVQTTKGFPSFQDVSPDFWGYFDLIEACVGHNYIVADDGTEVWTFATLGA